MTGLVAIGTMVSGAGGRYGEYNVTIVDACRLYILTGPSSKPDLPDGMWHPQTSTLTLDQVFEIVAPIRSNKRYGKIRINLAALRVDLNGLLTATGLCSDAPYPDPFLRSMEGKNQRNEQHAYTVAIFDELAASLSALDAVCSGGEVRAFLDDIFGTQPVELRFRAPLGITRTVIEVAYDRLVSLSTIPSSDAHGQNNPFADQISDVLKDINRVIHKLKIDAIGPQLNATLRKTLGDLVTQPETGSPVSTIEITFTDVLMCLNALEGAATRIAGFERTQITRHRPGDTELNLFLIELADVFLRITRSDQSRSSLKAGPKSPFVHFVMNVLERFYPPNTFTPEGFAKRWQRLRIHED